MITACHSPPRPPKGAPRWRSRSWSRRRLHGAVGKVRRKGTLGAHLLCGWCGVPPPQPVVQPVCAGKAGWWRRSPSRRRLYGNVGKVRRERALGSHLLCGRRGVPPPQLADQPVCAGGTARRRLYGLVGQVRRGGTLGSHLLRGRHGMPAPSPVVQPVCTGRAWRRQRWWRLRGAMGQVRRRRAHGAYVLCRRRGMPALPQVV